MAEAAKSATSENFMVSACVVFYKCFFCRWIYELLADAVRLRDEENVVSNDLLTLSKRDCKRGIRLRYS